MAELFKDLAIALFGIVGFVAGSYSSVLQIVDGFQHTHTLLLVHNSTNVTFSLTDSATLLSRSILLNRPRGFF